MLARFAPAPWLAVTSLMLLPAMALGQSAYAPAGQPGPRSLPIANVGNAKGPQQQYVASPPSAYAPPAAALGSPWQEENFMAESVAETPPLLIERKPRGTPFGGRIGGGYSTGGELQFTQWDVAGRFMIPLNPPKRMLAIAPAAGMTFLDAGNFVDTPDELYQLSLGLMWMEQLNERWRLQLMVSPTLRGDEESLGENVRIMAMALAHWTCSDQLRFTFGVVALGRDDIPVVPALGLLWTPTDAWEINISMPAPRVAHRVWTNDSGKAGWLYVAGGLGGGTWDVERADGRGDELNVTEFRLTFGGELVSGFDKRAYVEAGFGFGRELEYESGGETESYDPGVFIQAGWSF